MCALLSIAHIINPFQPIADADLAIAQPITFTSLKTAKEASKPTITVELLSAQFQEDRPFVPEGFTLTNDLDRNSTELIGLNNTRKLPFIADILQRAFDESEAEYIVYTNVDIAVQPQFYNRLVEIIDDGHDGFIINRRRLPAGFTSPEELPEMYAKKGKSHPGFDCFIIKREWIPKFSLDQILVGVPFIGIAMAQNVFHFAANPHVFESEILTFHIGEEIFLKRAPKAYFKHNRRAFWRAMKPLLPSLDSRKWPYGNKALVERMIRWGLNPSLPIRLALLLEPRRWK
ncbi:MAG: hypothetical protein Salg2KO_18200 [Salibacteraceae bacterium]